MRNSRRNGKRVAGLFSKTMGGIAESRASKLYGNRHARNNERKWSRFGRGFLWVSLFLYFCSSGPDFLWFLRGFSPSSSSSDGYSTTPISSSRHPQFQKKTTVSTSDSLVSRALVELNETRMQPVQTLSPGLWNGMKVYVYDLPSKYNTRWLSNPRCSTHLFAAEVAIHKVLLHSPVRTLDPYEADFFFVPVYVSCNFSTPNGFPAIGHARPLLSSAVDDIAKSWPFWNRSDGSDHVFVASHDYGACFHAMEDVAKADGIAEFLKSSIILQTFGVKGPHPCQDSDHIQIPPYISPDYVKATLTSLPKTHKRDIWAFFRGKMEIHPKNISGRIYSKGIRTMIWKNYHHHRKFYLMREKFQGYQQEMARSVFCLCPLGWAPWSPRIVESVALGCVPVIIADGIRLPFPEAVRWSQISISVAEKDVGKLGKILERVAATNLTAIQKNLWTESNRRTLLYTDPIQPGDATWHVLDNLARKRHHRSLRRRWSNQ
ncbi:hypothetical protein AMTRI_Chr07g27410 [Amborella trichopoda]|uniref:probable glucuronoxylan glucuronosyltransferase IRX7 isoform X2 n=1 Tax=Amborella trichopoda TaxID=13333 RepID=UPI0005D36CE7|nr:probable glucuronoxylan glucuronosyltransferase IRX7 isoform X2 [Amborella trichopoda]|eukprot:XP_011625900.1 probable glucuronoxylan glucuronosyltransferase IRX7 isoform X2 [Amborella trichopoda]